VVACRVERDAYGGDHAEFLFQEEFRRGVEGNEGGEEEDGVFVVEEVEGTVSGFGEEGGGVEY